jgi:hypothetical protein
MRTAELRMNAGRVFRARAKRLDETAVASAEAVRPACSVINA